MGSGRRRSVGPPWSRYHGIERVWSISTRCRDEVRAPPSGKDHVAAHGESCESSELSRGGERGSAFPLSCSEGRI